MNTRRSDDSWFVADDGDAVLEIQHPIHRAKVRAAVIRFCEQHGHQPSDMTRKVIWAMCGDEAVDGFDEGVDLALG